MEKWSKYQEIFRMLSLDEQTQLKIEFGSNPTADELISYCFRLLLSDRAEQRGAKKDGNVRP